MLQLCILMKQLTAFLQLIRWRNLLIVFGTQWVVWQCVVRPMEKWSAVTVFLEPVHFLLLSLSTVLIAAAGYVINDYFDVKIDVINRPQKVIVDRIISRRAAILWHSILNIAGFILALYLAMLLKRYALVGLQLSSIILLWFYSTTYKRMFVSGNVIVALLAALTVLAIAFYEPALYPHLNGNYFLFANGHLLVNPMGVIMVYAYFAFMLTWMREIVKDMEDFKGDAEQGCITMPIKIGLRKSIHFIFSLGGLAILPLLLAAIRLLLGAWLLLGVYIIVALVVPLGVWLYFLGRKATTQHYARASRWLKVIMLLGITTLGIYYVLQY